MMLLLHGYEWFDDNVQRIAGERGLPTLTRSESMLMMHLGDGVTRPAEIARLMRVSRQAVHQTINELVRKEIVNLEQDPKDGRAKVLRFRESAEDLRIEILQIMDSLEDQVLASIGPEDLDAMKRALSADWNKK